MDDDIDRLLVDVRASTGGFEADIARMRGSFDATLVDGFARAGGVLERGLLSAIRRGSLGFDDLRRIANQALDQIAAHALQIGLDSILGGLGSGGSGGGLLGGLLGAVFGLPGRATGGPVAPGRGYLVGERGPELFVPTSAGRVEPSLAAGGGRDVRVAITLNQPRGASAPASLRRSSRQVASAVRRALLQS
ncbi:tail tape measure protein [Altererythrobacter sp. H2]|uniref:tail tape measure protein n=1 Tax=Altererythrobacter sp. H2 TaxID=3108391 RepID=UPI002B4C02C5|nr:tail tape measure protein [Altererythrobacter sp. H2]WRK96332.1 tail tape measure protein [Altererythrobacter sp. H2]